MNLEEAKQILKDNKYVLEKYSDFLPDPDPVVEKEILAAINADDSRSFGPDYAYEKAYDIVSEAHPELDLPSDRSDFEEIYGYDPDDPPSEVINKYFG